MLFSNRTALDQICFSCLFVCLAQWLCNNNKRENYLNLWTWDILPLGGGKLCKGSMLGNYSIKSTFFDGALTLFFMQDFDMEPLISATLSYFNYVRQSMEKMKKKENNAKSKISSLLKTMMQN